MGIGPKQPPFPLFLFSKFNSFLKIRTLILPLFGGILVFGMFLWLKRWISMPMKLVDDKISKQQIFRELNLGVEWISSFDEILGGNLENIESSVKIEERVGDFIMLMFEGIGVS